MQNGQLILSLALVVENEWFYYVIGLFYSSIIGNIFALGVHTIQIYPHLIHQVAIVLIDDTLRLEIERE